MIEGIVFGSISLLVGFAVGCLYTDGWHKRERAKAEAAEVARLAKETATIEAYKRELWAYEIEQHMRGQLMRISGRVR